MSDSILSITLDRDDATDQWTAHALEFDVVSQGTSPKHALEMVQEAVELVLADDVHQGRDSTTRRAPEEEWVEFRKTQRLSGSVPGAGKYNYRYVYNV